MRVAKTSTRTTSLTIGNSSYPESLPGAFGWTLFKKRRCDGSHEMGARRRNGPGRDAPEVPMLELACDDQRMKNLNGRLLWLSVCAFCLKLSSKTKPRRRPSNMV